jgi:hypothetical protein
MKTLSLGLVVLLIATGQAAAADHRVEQLNEPAPADALSPEIAALLAPQGVRVIRGESRQICDIWMCREWPVEALEPGENLIYPLRPGQLIGVVRFPRKGSDFRDQDIAAGVYTLRYGLQPVDGAHVGTSPTRDFLLLLSAADDTSTDVTPEEELKELSAKAAGTTHPCLLSLQRTEGDQPIRHLSDRDWWLVRLNGKLTNEGQAKELALDLVVVGKAE